MPKRKNYFTFDFVQKHNEFRSSAINLQPSENILSPKVKNILSSDLAGRYSLNVNDYIHGNFVKNAYGGTDYFEKILEHGTEIAKKLFGFKYAEIRPLSGHLSAMISLLSTLEKGDSYFAISPENGGYDGYSDGYLPDILSLKYYPIPFNLEIWNIDYEEFQKKAREIKPDAIILGASYILFPYDLKWIREIADENNSYVLYDASHVLGLIAGNEFQPDALNYVDLLFGSTHKTFFGPQGGIILTNDEELFKKIEKNIVWKTMDNYHLNRVAALVQAMEEMYFYGSEYAKNVINNSKSLGKFLKEFGLIKDFEGKITDSHQIFLKEPSICNRFIESYLITDCVGRIGTNEVSRLGIGEKDMVTIGNFMIRSLKENVKNEVIKFRKMFKIKYY